MKKSFFDKVSYSCYKYAPESFKLSVCGKEIIGVPQHILSDFGNTLITNGQKEVMKKIKKYFRKNSIIANKTSSELLCARTGGKNILYLTYWRINKYDIDEKLRYFKALKEAVKQDGSQMLGLIYQ